MHVVCGTENDVMFGKKVKCYIYADYGDIYKIVGVKKVKLTAETFKFADRQFVIDLTKCILTKRNNPTLHYHLNNSMPITFKQPVGDVEVHSKHLQAILNSDILKRVNKVHLDKYMLILVIALVCGLTAVAMYSMYLLSG